MHIHEHLNPALQSILLNWTRGYHCWTVTPPLPRTKAESILQLKWPERYGTQLPAWKRQDRKARGLPSALSLGAPVVSMPEHVQCFLMATPRALLVPAASPFAQEAWATRCPELSEYVLIHEPRHDKQYAWTWRLQESTMLGLERRLATLVSTGQGHVLANETAQWVRFYCAYGGVRRQLRHLLRSYAKLWNAKYQSGWPGPDPERLPAQIGFKPGLKKQVERSPSL